MSNTATQLGKISLADLAKNSSTTLNFGKAGGKGGAQGSYVDPFTLDISYPVEFTAEEITERKDGSPQLQLSVSIMKDDGSLAKAGKLWVDLIDASADAATQQKQGERLRKFLRAIDPTNFSVYATINKGVEPWEYVTGEGEVISYDERELRNAQINAAVVAASEGLIAGELSAVGARCFVQKVANPKSERYPFVNFSAEAF